MGSNIDIKKNIDADMLVKLACYRSERYDDEKLHDVPEIRFLIFAIGERKRRNWVNDK